MGPNTEPCGTPHSSPVLSDRDLGVLSMRTILFCFSLPSSLLKSSISGESKTNLRLNFLEDEKQRKKQN